MSARETVSPTAVAAQQGLLDGIELSFHEVIAGLVTLGETDMSRGAERGSTGAATLRLEVDVDIRDLGRFLRVPEHDAALRGTVTFAPLGGTFPIQNGRFNLFTIDPAVCAR